MRRDAWPWHAVRRPAPCLLKMLALLYYCCHRGVPTHCTSVSHDCVHQCAVPPRRTQPHIGDATCLLTPLMPAGNSLDYTDKCMDIMKEHEASVKEMEAAAIAWVTALFGTPLVCVKVGRCACSAWCEARQSCRRCRSLSWWSSSQMFKASHRF
jgi:hypothetical protein